MHVFKLVQWQDKKPIIVVQVFVAKRKHNGPQNQAKQHIMSETSLQLCYMTINDQNKFNPLKTWVYVSWQYIWLKGFEGTQHYVWITVILVKREEILLQKLDRFGWFPILLELKKMFFKGKTMLFFIVQTRKKCNVNIDQGGQQNNKTKQAK